MSALKLFSSATAEVQESKLSYRMTGPFSNNKNN